MRQLLFAGTFAALGVSVATLSVSCNRRTALPKAFVELHKEAWGSWAVHILQHAPSSKCFVVVDPPGDGGGAITEASDTVCAAYTRVETK